MEVTGTFPIQGVVTAKNRERDTKRTTRQISAEMRRIALTISPWLQMQQSNSPTLAPSNLRHFLWNWNSSCIACGVNERLLTPPMLSAVNYQETNQQQLTRLPHSQQLALGFFSFLCDTGLNESGQGKNYCKLCCSQQHGPRLDRNLAACNGPTFRSARIRHVCRFVDSRGGAQRPVER